PIVIWARQDRAHRAKGDATVPRREIFPTVRRVFLIEVVLHTGGFPPLRLRCEWRNTTIGRIHNQRRLAIRFSIIEPAGRYLDWPIWGGGALEIGTCLHLGEPLLVFLVVENGPSSHPGVPFHRSRDHVG